MEYSSVMSYIKWNSFTPIAVYLGTVCADVCWTTSFMKYSSIVILFTEAVQFSNYVLILTLVGPANGFMAVNTTTTFRFMAVITGLLTAINLAFVIISAVKYCRSWVSKRSAILNEPPTSQRLAKSKQPSLMCVKYEEAVSGRVKMPSIMKIIDLYKTYRSFKQQPKPDVNVEKRNQKFGPIT